MPTFALVDINNAYVSMERLFRPDLRGVPVIVLGNGDGCVVSRSNEAKALGIGMGEPYFKLRDLIEQHGVQVFSSNYALYGNLSARFMSVLGDLASQMSVNSIDEAWLSADGLQEPLPVYGRRVKAEVQRLVGLPVCVGIAPTKTLAKLANECAKKHTRSGVVDLSDPARQEKLLKLSPVGDVWGIGRQLKARLEAMNVATAWDLARQDPAFIRKAFSIVVEKTVRELRGESCFPLGDGPEPKKMIACSRSFSERITDLDGLREAVASYTSRAAEKLRAQGDYCRLLQVYIRTGVFNPNEPHYGRTASVPLPCPSHDTRDLVQAALAGLEGIYRPGYRYQKAGVVLMEFVSPGQIQGDLFAPAPRPGSEALMAALDQINARMGRGTVRLARVPAAPGWSMKAEMKSPAYVSRWSELPIAT
ncbi:translesion error-prone DNA polymerase V subunit UmuC [Geopseudomonas aromaticivorans]